MPQFIAKMPVAITAAVEAFCSMLGGPPLRIRITPNEDAIAGRCYINAADEVEERGGTIQHGWLIWELPGLYLTAEHHAVVRRDDQLIDVTPALYGDQQALFVPTDMEWNNALIPNRYVPARDHPLLHRACELMRRNCVLQSEGRLWTPQFHANDREIVRCFEAFAMRLKERKGDAEARRKKRRNERANRRR